MEFGKVTTDTLDDIDFRLPQDHAENDRVLKAAPAKKTEVFIGCAKWGRKDWVGKIYPKGTKESDFLAHYGRHFNSIELNATFYRLPKKAQTKAWADKVGDNFRFCPKFTDKISHLKRLKDAESLTQIFLDGIGGFGEKLGPVFLMPHPGMGPQTLDTLEAFIQGLPKNLQVFVELRHAKWFSEKESFEAVCSLMERYKTGSVITDASGRRDCVHMRLTTPSAFIRFVGNGLHPTDYTRVDQWIQRIKIWMQKGIHSVYFFMHQNEEIHSPELCKYVIEQLNQHCGINMPVPQFQSGDAEAPKTRASGKK